MKSILEFSGEHRYLSNFYLCNFEWDGAVWPSSEAAYQAAKTLDSSLRKSFLNISPSAAKRLGKNIPLRDDWEDVRLVIMAEIVYAKFTQNPDLLQKLLSTSGILEEGNYWGDKFWGVSPAGSGKGQNHLGRILMELRDLYKGETQGGLVSFS